jgi:hypothetical protein
MLGRHNKVAKKKSCYSAILLLDAFKAEGRLPKKSCYSAICCLMLVGLQGQRLSNKKL